MFHRLCATLGLAATLWMTDAAGAQSVAPREGAEQAARDIHPSADEAPAATVDDGGERDNGGLELRASALGGTFEGPLFGGEASAALFTAPREDQPLQFGFEAQVRHAVDTDPEGTLEDAALTSFTGNLVIRGAHGSFRPYAGVGAGGELYHYDSNFSDTSDSISGFVYQGFVGTTIDLRKNVFLDLRLTVADRDYEETTGYSFGNETIYARDVSFTASFGIGFRL